MKPFRQSRGATTKQIAPSMPACFLHRSISEQAMQEDNKTIQFQDLNEILHHAQLRRSADLGVWFRQYLQDRRLARQQREMDAKHAVTTQSGALAH